MFVNIFPNKYLKHNCYLFLTSEEYNCYILHETKLVFSGSVGSDSLRHHGLQHARFPCPSPSPRAQLKLTSMESVISSNHLILCRPFLLLPSMKQSILLFKMICPF